MFFVQKLVKSFFCESLLDLFNKNTLFSLSYFVVYIYIYIYIYIYKRVSYNLRQILSDINLHYFFINYFSNINNINMTILII